MNISVDEETKAQGDFCPLSQLELHTRQFSFSFQVATILSLDNVNLWTISQHVSLSLQLQISGIFPYWLNKSIESDQHSLGSPVQPLLTT